MEFMPTKRSSPKMIRGTKSTHILQLAYQIKNVQVNLHIMTTLPVPALAIRSILKVHLISNVIIVPRAFEMRY